MTFEEIFLEVLKWLGGGGVALLGLYLTKKKDTSQNKFNIINELQEENKRKDDRLDKQDEKIQFLVDQMDEMRRNMFELQTDKHRSEVKNVELQSKNDRLVREKEEIANKLIFVEEEKNQLKEQLENELGKVKRELNERIDKLITENEELRKQIFNLNKN